MNDRPGLAASNVLVAIDDTDNCDSRGTGQLARLLAQALDEFDLGSVLAVTRHLLLVDDRIPYTSHNSSACIALRCTQPDVDAITAAAAEFLEKMSATGSDPGLAVATAANWDDPVSDDQVRTFGLLAKREVLDQAAARTVADDTGIRLSAHGRDGGGIIGALAAIGLHHSAGDGRFLWLPRLRPGNELDRDATRDREDLLTHGVGEPGTRRRECHGRLTGHSTVDRSTPTATNTKRRVLHHC